MFTRTLYIACLVFSLFSSNLLCAAESTRVTINKKSNNQTDYMNSLLRLALAYSDTAYEYDSTDSVYSRDRVMEAMRSGEIAVTWGGTSEQLESDFIPIKIDAYRGLMSHRLFFIKQGKQPIFSQIQTLEDLKKITFGQGRSWQDASILEKAGFHVIRATKKDSLFHMLDGDRFDAFPRGATEIVSELRSFPNLALAVEEELVVIYPLPSYFFVSKSYPKLAQSIESGLQKAIEDGSFDRYFFGSQEIVEALKRANFPKRRAFRIENPYLPANTPNSLGVSIDFINDPRVLAVTQEPSQSLSPADN